MSEIDLARKIELLEKRVAALETQETTLFDMDGTEKTIDSGVIRKGTGKITWHTVDTEADAASDDLNTINDGQAGDILFLSAADSARTVVLIDNADNLRLTGDLSLTNAADMVCLLYKNALWYEVSFSDIAA